MSVGLFVFFVGFFRILTWELVFLGVVFDNNYICYKT